MKLAVGLALLLRASAAFCDFPTGNSILRFCRNATDPKETSFGAGYCLGWVSGAAVAYQALKFAEQGDKTGGIYFIPQGATPEQLVRVFVKWLEAHPEMLHEEAFRLFYFAMNDAFPEPKRVAPSPTPARDKN